MPRRDARASVREAQPIRTGGRDAHHGESVPPRHRRRACGTDSRIARQTSAARVSLNDAWSYVADNAADWTGLATRDAGGAMAGALEDVRIIDFTHVLNGPFCTMLLGHLGAEIIKIEPPGGDSFRHIWMPKD